MSRTLRHRRRNQRLFELGDYVALPAEGARARNVFAFARATKGAASLTVVGRLMAAVAAGRTLPIGEAIWTDTRLPLPQTLPFTRYRDVLTGRVIQAETTTGAPVLQIAHAFANLPVAVLEPV
jgi:(1->4)-alpha-D-glucan 1-alpha-D-glucosylmutase